MRKLTEPFGLASSHEPRSIRREWMAQRNQLEELEIRYSDLKRMLDSLMIIKPTDIDESSESQASSLVGMEPNRGSATRVGNFTDYKELERKLNAPSMKIDKCHHELAMRRANEREAILLQNPIFCQRLDPDRLASACDNTQDDRLQSDEATMPRTSRPIADIQHVQANVFPSNANTIQTQPAATWNGTTSYNPAAMIHDPSYESMTPCLASLSLCDDSHHAPARGSSQCEMITNETITSPFGEGRTLDRALQLPIIYNENIMMNPESYESRHSHGSVGECFNPNVNLEFCDNQTTSSNTAPDHLLYADHVYADHSPHIQQLDTESAHSDATHHHYDTVYESQFEPKVAVTTDNDLTTATTTYF